MFRQRLIYILMAILILAVSLTGCERPPEYQKFAYEFFGTFDTVVQVMGYTPNQRTFNQHANQIEKRFIELHQMFDIYNNYDDVVNLKTVNDMAGEAPVAVPREIFDLIKLSLHYRDTIASHVDITMGPVLKVWHNYRDEGLYDPANAQLPPMDELDAAAQRMQSDGIVLDEAAQTVFLQHKGMRLDVGAIAKGYATQLVSDEIHAAGLTSFLIVSGGNVKGMGAPLDGNRFYWGIGLQNPYYFDDMKNEEQLIDIAFVNDRSVVSSGNYQRYYTVDGIRYHHLIDPNTLMPADYFDAVTVVAADSALADFLSTAIFLMPYDDGRALIDSMADVEAYWVLPDRSILATDGMIPLLKHLGGASSTVQR